MNPVALFLLVVAGVFLVGIAAEWVFRRTGIPDVLWLLGVGILLGPVLGIAPRTHLATVAPYFGAITIVIVLFDGGMALRLTDLGRTSGRAGALAVLGFLLSAAGVAAASLAAAHFGVLPESWNWLHATTLGAILGGSSSVVVMPALRTANAPTGVATMLGVESALTDVLCIVGTGVCMEIAVGGETGAGAISLALVRTLGVGLVAGGAAGVLSLWVLRRVTQSGNAFPIALSFLLVVYVTTELLQGSAPLAILAAAVIVGNAPVVSPYVGIEKPVHVGRSLRGVHGQVTFMVKTFFFTFMGAMLAPPWSLLLLGVCLALCILAVRLPAVLAATAGMGLDRPSLQMAHVCMPRGMAAGVLSGMPFAMGIEEMRDAPVVVFAAVATSIVIFAAGFAYARRGSATAPAAAVPVPVSPPGA